MKDKKKQIIKKILIHESVKENFKIPFTPEAPIIFCSNIKSKIDTVLLDCDGYTLLTLIIIPVEQYGEIHKFLNLTDYSGIFYQIILIGREEDIINQKIDRLYHIADFLTEKTGEYKIGFVIKKAFSIIEKHFQNEQEKRWYYNRLIDSQRDQEDLIDIGKALSAEKDQDQLLRLILYLSKKMTGADAGSIYLVEEDEYGRKRLRFKYSHTFSRTIPLEKFVMDIDINSISGYVASTGEVLNIPDAYKIDELAPYSFNPYFDRQHNYISRSMIVVPMKNHSDQIIGVIQLINSKEDLSGSIKYDNEAFQIKLETKDDFDRYVVTFDEKYNGLLEAIAGQAAIAIENNRLINQIQTQFEEFVKASVTAIESRDPATSGHSFRVAEICREIAKAVINEEKGYLSQFSFSENNIKELEFAALLHDFGKVYIDPNIFRKAKKLFPADFENLILRLDYLYRFTELKYSVKEKELLLHRLSHPGREMESLDKLDRDQKSILSDINKIKNDLIRLNEPTITDGDPNETLASILEKINSLECIDISGKNIEILTDKDRMNLVISRGSLNPVERKEIESHVIETYKFVSKIPWPPEYKNIPEIALRHHEMIDGSGYPDGLKGREATSLQSRMMSIADIFDALTAQDRPYKKSVPLDTVLKILQEEAEKNKLDPDLVGLFINRKIYLKVISTSRTGN
jgi:HD-GYP domain-containing protein (c-di-GMP phosphodiesterase class II)